MLLHRVTQVAIASSACLIALVTGATTAHTAGPRRAILSVTNPTSQPRPEEVLEVPLAAIQSRLYGAAPQDLRAEDLATHRALPVQLDRDTSASAPDKLLVLVSLTPHQTIRLAFYTSHQPANFRPLVYGRSVAERKDDFAWENDKVAYRVYGPALQATGEITSGIDVWSKRVPDLIINAWYNRDAEGQRTHNPAFSYHKDQGQGLDSYEVGPSRGCGGTGLWSNGHLFASKNYISAKILASGPIRFRFSLRYAPWTVDGMEVSEQKIITLDAGSHLNRIESTFFFNGKTTEMPAARWAAGLALHKGAQIADAQNGGIVSVWEQLTLPTAGMDGTSIVLPPGRTAATMQSQGNALVLLPATPGSPITYYAGAAWSKFEIPDQTAWNHYLEAFRERLAHPLRTSWE
jgi:hypothetical protein